MGPTLNYSLRVPTPPNRRVAWVGIMVSLERIFTLQDARRLLPEIQEVTAGAAARVDELTAQVIQLDESDARRDALVVELNRIVEQWAERMAALDVEAKGMWLVDFDNGHGYYCWRYPEPAIQHFHGYEDGFAGRMKIV